MKKFFFTFALTFLAVANVFSQVKLPRIIGAYDLDCVVMVCQTIRINSDYTFDLYTDGDLFNEEKNKGTWKFLSNDKIQFNTPKPLLIVETKETIVGNSEKITVLIQDEESASIPDAKIKYFYKNQEINVLTNESGTVEIPKVQIINISCFGYNQDYSIQNTKTTHLLIKITPTPSRASFDRVMKIKKSKLCDVDESNDAEFCYSKLSRKKELKIFPSLAN